MIETEYAFYRVFTIYAVHVTEKSRAILTLFGHRTVHCYQRTSRYWKKSESKFQPLNWSEAAGG